MKSATNIDEQLRLLKNRGMNIENESKAREILMDIGYYRLGFYWFHMEKSYPNKNNRQHICSSMENLRIYDIGRHYNTY